jgi:hypothetical protein
MNIEKEKFPNTIQGSNGLKVLMLFILLYPIYCLYGFTNGVESKSVGSKTPRYSGTASDCCFLSIAKKTGLFKYRNAGAFAKKSYVGGNKITSHGTLIIKNVKTGKDLKLSSNTNNIEDWDEQISWESVQYSSISAGSSNYLIARAKFAGASGLGSNFRNYLIINLHTGKFYIVKSLAEDPFFFYVKNDLLEFYLFDFSEDFLSNRDYENITFNQQKFKIEHGNIINLGNKTVKCTCKN